MLYNTEYTEPFICAGHVKKNAHGMGKKFHTGLSIKHKCGETCTDKRAYSWKAASMQKKAYN